MTEQEKKIDAQLSRTFEVLTVAIDGMEERNSVKLRAGVELLVSSAVELQRLAGRFTFGGQQE